MVTPAQLAEAQRLRTQLQNASRTTRAFCQSATFRGDRLACAAASDAVDAFLAPSSTPSPAGVFSRLYDRAAAGDADAYRRMMESGSRILLTVSSVPFDLRDVTVTDLVERIAVDARAAAGEVGAGVGVGAVVAGVVAAIIFVGRR